MLHNNLNYIESFYFPLRIFFYITDYRNDVIKFLIDGLFE